ncbi:MAG: ABC transporter ATP-binding protein [Gammaproteobacteria bacterium]|nr:ABC transporter ATP-binding protein [Gammaproteobacteria bacterium]
MLRSLIRLRTFATPYLGTLSLGILAFLGARVFEALVPLFLAHGIDSLARGDYNVLIPVMSIIAAVLARFAVVTYARITVRKVGQNVSFDLRQRLFQQLQAQGAAFYNRNTIGDMMTRAVADIGLIQRLIAMGTILLVILVFAAVVGFSFMLALAPTLTLLILPPLPFVFLYAWYASRQMGVASHDVQERLSDLGAHVQENLSGIRTIQAMVQEENEVRRFAATNQAYADSFYRQAHINSAMMAWMPSLTLISALIILGYGGHLVMTGAMSVGVFVAFHMYLGMVVQPFRVAGFIVNLFQRAAVAAGRLFEIFDLEPEIADTPSGRTQPQIRGEIDIRHLTYRYQGATVSALDSVDLHIDAGEIIAIMGRVGSGKTTLLKTLVRLLDPPRGTIFIDGHDVHDYPLSQLRSQVAMVPQDPFLFADAIGSNVTYDDPSREADRIWLAADAADLRDTIEDFPARLDTLVGERGVTLSGGQKQRATLARGLIRHAPVLILDDCFSSVDTETEEHILSELKQLRRQQTTILVSHRVSTARHADRIVIFDEGRIVEVGGHTDLLASGGYYAELERIQREGAAEADYLAAGAPA